MTSTDQIELRKAELEYDIRRRRMDLDAALEIRRSMLDLEKYKFSHTEEQHLKSEIQTLLDQMNNKCNGSANYDLDCMLNFSNLLSKIKFGFNLKRTSSTQSLCNDFNALQERTLSRALSSDLLASRSLERVNITPKSRGFNRSLSSDTSANTPKSKAISREKIEKLKKLLKYLKVNLYDEQ